MMKIHSMIDAITNSSAEVYVFLNDNAEQKVKDLIYTIVKSIDPTINIEDYFEFKIGINQNYIDDCLVGKKDYTDFKNQVLLSDQKLSEDQIKDKFSEYVQENYEDYVDDVYGGDNKICYIKVKGTQQKIDISYLIDEMFTLEASYD